MAVPFAPMAPGGIDGRASKWSALLAWQARARKIGGRRNVLRARRREAPQAPKVLFEPLEQRYLLSADLSPLVVAMLDQGNELTVRLDSHGDTLQVVNDQTGHVVGEQAVSRTSQVQILGTDRADRLTVDFTTPFGLAQGIKFIGASGDDQVNVVGSGAVHGPLAIDAGGAALTNRGDLQSDHVSFRGGDIFNYGNLAAGPNGQITLQAAAEGHLTQGGRLDAVGQLTGETGGLVELLGGTIDLLGTAAIDASGAGGGGTVRIGGDARGAGPLPNAQTTTVAAGATIDVSALASGDGGSTVIWADGATLFAGSIIGQGGISGGDGGFAEVSGKVALGFDGSVDLSAPSGAGGTLLLDPTTIHIVHAPSASQDGTLPTVSSGDSPSSYTISDAALEAEPANQNISLAATGSITIDDLSGNVLALLTGRWFIAAAAAQALLLSAHPLL